MASIMFELLADIDFSGYLIRDLNGEVTQEDIEDVVEKIRNLPIHFATIDLGSINLRDFNNTYLAEVLKQFEIPYFTVESPHYVKDYFSSQITELQERLSELKATYNSLEDKNSPTAKELGYLIYDYSDELKDLKHYINNRVRTDAITKRILEILKGREDKGITFVHFGEENTFVEISKKLKESNVKSNILFIQKSKFLN
ncbi:MAG: hypothetical protein ACFE9Q_13715 [Candidatus Hodarchaeota archaeon]